MNKQREKTLIRLGLNELGPNLREQISNYHTDKIIKFIREVINKLESTHCSYVYPPLDSDIEYLTEYYDHTRHLVMGDIATQIEINSIAADYY